MALLSSWYDIDGCYSIYVATIVGAARAGRRRHEEILICSRGRWSRSAIHIDQYTGVLGRGSIQAARWYGLIIVLWNTRHIAVGVAYAISPVKDCVSRSNWRNRDVNLHPVHVNVGPADISFVINEIVVGFRVAGDNNGVGKTKVYNNCETILQVEYDTIRRCLHVRFTGRRCYSRQVNRCRRRRGRSSCGGSRCNGWAGSWRRNVRSLAFLCRGR